MQKMLTIAIPTYNGEATIGQVLSILLPQVDNRVEVVVCDNSSTDNTLAIVEEYRNDYPFLQVEENECNIGADSNYLKCMQNAKGKYTLLLSDDDVLLEGSLSVVLDFLEQNEDMSLIYINAVCFYERFESLDQCQPLKRAVYDGSQFCTKNKTEFMRYAGRMWGFLSCFVCLTAALHSISDGQKYKGTNWLQSYLHILCSNYESRLLGVISEPIIGAGVYSIVSNMDSAQVDGVNYRKMLDFAVSHGFNKKQLDDLFIWRLCFISKRAVIKERASGIKRANLSTLIDCTKEYPYAWIHLYPFLIAPRWLCKLAISINARNKYTKALQLNRVGDVTC